MKTEQSCLQLHNRWSSRYAKKKAGNQVLENKISTQIRGRWLFLKLALKVKTFWNNNIVQHICGFREILEDLSLPVHIYSQFNELRQVLQDWAVQRNNKKKNSTEFNKAALERCFPS